MEAFFIINVAYKRPKKYPILLISDIFQNFERPFTPRGWLRSASNLGKTRFRWFPTFHFSTPEKIFLMKFSEQKVRMKSKVVILEELRWFEHDWQLRLEKWPPMKSFSGLCDFWWRGKSSIKVFFRDFWTKWTFTIYVIWWYDDMERWRIVLLGNDEMSWLEHTNHLDWNTNIVLIGTHEMSWLEHRKCLDWTRRNVLRASGEILYL